MGHRVPTALTRSWSTLIYTCLSSYSPWWLIPAFDTLVRFASNCHKFDFERSFIIPLSQLCMRMELIRPFCHHYHYFEQLLYSEAPTLAGPALSVSRPYLLVGGLLLGEFHHLNVGEELRCMPVLRQQLQTSNDHTAIITVPEWGLIAMAF